MIVQACDGSVADGNAGGYYDFTEQQLPNGFHRTQNYRLTWTSLSGAGRADFWGTATTLVLPVIENVTVTGHARLYQDGKLYSITAAVLHLTISPDGTVRLVSLSHCK